MNKYITILFILGLCSTNIAWGHGFAGKRFFPSTLAVDDPFVSDELTLLYNHFKEPDETEDQLNLALAKRIFTNLGLEISETYDRIRSPEHTNYYGFENLGLGIKYQFLTDAKRELILSIGVDFDLDNTGCRHIADPFTTISPTFFFGKGMGNLFDNYKYLKPIAVTGTIGASFPSRNLDDKTFNWGLTFQYNFQYLQSNVKDIGMEKPFNRMIILVEFPMTTNLNGLDQGLTTGTVNPGIIWFGKKIQLGAEAQFPINKQTGKDVGVLLQVHFFLDDIFPNSIGRPIFDEK